MLFAYAILLFRLLGARALSQLSLAEVVLVVGLGSAIGDPMMYPDVPITHGLMVITVVVVLQRILTWLTTRNKAVQRVMEPHAVRLVADGEIDGSGLRTSSLSHNELYAELRQMGVENLANVKRAYLEPDGNFSVFQFEGLQSRGENYDLIEDADRLKSA